MQSFCSICPRFDAAAVCTIALCPSMRMVSTMPRTVRGLTKQDAPSFGVVPSGITRHCPACKVLYFAYIAPPSIATVLPISACASSDDPALTTTPAPSLPQASALPTLGATYGCMASGIFALIIGLSDAPTASAVVISAKAKSIPISDGLIGDACISTTTSSSPGSGTSAVSSRSSK